MTMDKNSAEVIGLIEKVKKFIAEGDKLPKYEREKAFNNLCVACFRVQAENIPGYARLCAQKKVDIDGVSDFLQIPPVPVQAFKTSDIFIYSKDEIHKTFKTSGTSKSSQGLAYFSAAGSEITSLAIVKNARAYLFPDNLDTKFFLIAPSPEAAPNLTMAYGITEVMKNVGTYGGRHYIGKEGIDWRSLFSDLKECVEKNIAATIIAPSFAIVFMLDKMAAENIRFKLPKGSRILDAGGFKGKSREISRDEMIKTAAELLGVVPGYCVNALGMSELGTQYYDNNLKNLIEGAESPVAKENPHWAKTFVVDIEDDFKIIAPETYGKTGALLHFDLTNIDRAVAILTDDSGRYAGSGFEICGRLSPDDMKGCSLTVEEMLLKRP